MLAIMIGRCLSIALLAGACGQVTQSHVGDAGGGGDGPSDGAVSDAGPIVTSFKGTLTETSPVAFGGAFGGTMYCNYTITLKQLEVNLGIVLATNQVMSGKMQALNVEATDPSCPYDPLPASIANYTLQSTAPDGTALKLTFQGASTNVPMASLVANLTRSGSSYTAMLTFHRTDQPAPFDWTVTTTVLVAPL